MEHLIKLAHYQKELEQFSNNELVIPRRVQIDPVAFCNHDCSFCTYRYTQDDDMNALFNLKDIIPLRKMLEIFDDCVELGVKAVEITGGGEPSLHPHFHYDAFRTQRTWVRNRANYKWVMARHSI